ncbi:MAG: hypothetical protein GC187_00760 [Alphaproteobacteria bacterium]|nr:hypothetical protein [Alphaproteobacteria bacterium]
MSTLAALAATISVLFASASAAAQEPAGDALYDGAFFKRQAIIVSDMDRALTLYRDVLGFELHSLTQSGPDSYSYEVFNIPREASIRFATLDAGDVQVRTLALIEVTGVALDPLTGIRRAAAVIDAHGRYQAIVEAIDAMGLERAQPRALGEASSARGQGVELGFTDWDGNLIVIYEFPQPEPPAPR